MNQINTLDYFSNNDFLNECFPDGNYKPYFSDDDNFLDDSFLNDNNNINEDFGNNRKSTNVFPQITPNTPLTPLEVNKINFPQKTTNFLLTNPKITTANIARRVPNPQLQQPLSKNFYHYNRPKNFQNTNFKNTNFTNSLSSKI